MKSKILLVTALLTLSASMSAQTRRRVVPPKSAKISINLQADVVYQAMGPEWLARATFQEALTATAQSITSSEDSASAITLAGTGAKGSALTYRIVTKASHGTLSGEGASQTYLPDANYNGSDRFWFRVSDGINTSPAASVSITVTAINDPPIQIAGGTNETISTGTQSFIPMFSNLQMSPGGGPDEASQTITCKFISLPPSGQSAIYQGANKAPVATGITFSWAQFKSMFLKKAQGGSVGSYVGHFQCTDSLGASSANIAYTATVN